MNPLLHVLIRLVYLLLIVHQLKIDVILDIGHLCHQSPILLHGLLVIHSHLPPLLYRSFHGQLFLSQLSVLQRHLPETLPLLWYLRWPLRLFIGVITGILNGCCIPVDHMRLPGSSHVEINTILFKPLVFKHEPFFMVFCCILKLLLILNFYLVLHECVLGYLTLLVLAYQK